ncbi:MAG: polysaccharide deacetylase family protein [Verrucomicrobia bacterium]|nr:polysaccharide deacetylase family protein [Verrucomicrobiota bacterium]
MRALVVSVHDVSPLTQASCDKIVQELRGLGIGTASLLVIPNHHGKAPVNTDPGFKEWMTNLVRQGYEPVLHGYYHARSAKPTDTRVTRFTTQFYTAGEGEFFDLGREEAVERLHRGMDDLAFLGRKIYGFVAPAWLLGYEAEAAVRKVGFSYITNVGSVKVFDGVHRYASRSLVWSTRAPWRRIVSLAWNQRLASRLHEKPLLRIGIHPADCEIPAVWSQVKSIITAALQDRQPLSYEKFVADHLEPAHNAQLPNGC